MRRKIYPWRQRPHRTRGPKPQPFRMHEDGIGYDTLRPTKGWRRVSLKQLQAQAILVSFRNFILNKRLNAAQA